MNEWQLKRNKVSPSIRYERNFYIILQKGHYVKKFLWKHKHFILLYSSKMLYALFSEEILKVSNYIRSCYYYIAWSQVLGPQLQQRCFSYISAINTSQFPLEMHGFMTRVFFTTVRFFQTPQSS